MRRMISVLGFAFALSPLLVGEEIATTFGGHPVTIGWSASAGVAGITSAELLAGARSAADSALVGREQPSLVRITALMDGHEAVLNGQIAVGLALGADPQAMATRYGLVLVSVLGRSAVLAAGSGNRLSALRTLPGVTTDPAVTWSEPVVVRTLRPRANPTDPLFTQEWYLDNTGPTQVTGAVAGNDLNVKNVWPTFTGAGIRIGVVDTGVLLNQEDLAANIGAGEGWNFVDGNANPSPGVGSLNLELYHGTMVAGIIAAARNTKGGVGVAYDASLVPLRLIDGANTTTTDAANALAWHLTAFKGIDPTKEVAVSNNSWGPADDGIDHGAAAENPSLIELNAMVLATTGRGGLGDILVWACGNGGDSDDTCDRDGYADSRYVIAVGAINADGRRSFYSEMGACLFINAPVGDSSAQQVLTTFCDTRTATPPLNDYDVGIGTSFSTPMVCGVIALMLEANPALSWRDVRDVLAKSAAKNDPTDPSWLTNGAGLHWNLKYGFGRVDALAAVNLALAYTPLPAEATPLTVSATPDLAIPDAGSAAAIPLVISGNPLFRCEAIELALDASHPRQGELAFTLISPRGTAVTFLARPNDTSAARVWTMSSVATWGEDPSGTWQLVARDVASGNTGSLHAVTLTIHGHLLAISSPVGTASASVVASPIISANGATSIPAFVAPPSPPSPPVSAPAPASQSKDIGGGGGCGLGAGSLGLLLPALLFLRLRRKHHL